MGEAAEAPKNRINIELFIARTADIYHQTICGFYVTQSDKRAAAAENVGFALFF
jgi:hypothetical protein